MKKNKWFGLALVATMMGASFSACSNDAEEVLAQESEIKLTSEITPSRVTSLNYQSAQIVSGQEVGVTITGADGEHNNIKWTANSDGTLTNTGNAVYYSGNNEVTIKAYHPYNSNWTDWTNGQSFSVSTDQSTSEGYLASDLLWTSTTTTTTKEAVPLSFRHCLAKINVTLKSDDGADLSGAIISICNTKITTTFYNTGLFEGASEVQEIKAGETTSTAYTASAIVIPQTITSDTKFIKVEHDNKTFYYTLDADKKLEAGCSYYYTLTVKKQGVELATCSNLNNWIPEYDNIGDAMEEARTIPNNEIWYTTNNGQTLTFNNAFDVEIESNTYNNGQGVITFNSDITTIKNGAFKDQHLTSITLPNGVTTIESSAFIGCSYLTSITIPKSVTNIGNNPFVACWSLTSIVVEEDNTVYDSRNDCNAIIETASNTLLTGCKNTVIPNSIVTIGVQAFTACSFLENITIPNSVVSILPVAFGNCTSLSIVNVNATTPPTLGVDVFTLAPQSLIIYVPASSVNAYKTAEGWSTYADKIYAQQ